MISRQLTCAELGAPRTYSPGRGRGRSKIKKSRRYIAGLGIVASPTMLNEMAMVGNRISRDSTAFLLRPPAFLLLCDGSESEHDA